MQKQYNASFSSKSFKSKSYITEKPNHITYSEYPIIITELVNSRNIQNNVANQFFKTHGVLIDW